MNAPPTAPLYMELPYPADGVVRTTSARVLRAGLARHAAHLLSKSDLLIADIGCGTGEATAGIARLFPNAAMLAVDVNSASLDKARALATRERLNIRFVQADITGNMIDAIRATGIIGPDRGFDLMISNGVLHHLTDPEAGFAVVRRLIEPDGFFLGYIYTKKGRWDDLVVREILDTGLAPDASFQDRADAVAVLQLSDRFTLRGFFNRLGNRLKFGPPLVLSEVLRVRMKRHMVTHVSDQFSNPCEHLYEFRELDAIFERTGWEFVALAEKGGLPVTPEQHTREPRALAILRSMPRDVLYDYFAFHYRVSGFCFYLRPKHAPPPG